MKNKNLYAYLKKIGDEYIQQLLATPIAQRYIHHVPQFYSWYTNNFEKLLINKFGKSRKVVSYVSRGGYRLMVNIFAAWLVHHRIATTYELIRGKYVAGAESIYTWLPAIRKLAKHDN